MVALHDEGPVRLPRLEPLLEEDEEASVELELPEGSSLLPETKAAGILSRTPAA